MRVDESAYLLGGGWMKKYLALGDSLTHGYGLKEEEKWPYLLSKLQGIEVINEGINGEELSEALLRLDEVLTHPVQKVFINFGTNDVMVQQDRFAQVDFVAFRKNMEKLIDAFIERNIEVIWISVHPIIEGDPKAASYFFGRHDPKQYRKQSPNDLLRLCRDHAQAVCEMKDVFFVDLFSDPMMQNKSKVLRTVENSGEEDGVHYSKEGAAYLAHYLDRILREEIE